MIRVLQYFFFFTCLFGIFNVSLGWIVLGLVMYAILETFGGNIGLHRYYGHKSFTTSERWETILRFCSHYIGVGSVVSWVGQHRTHHKHSDTKDDVHSRHVQGIWTICFGIWDMKIERKYIRDVMKDEKLRWWNKNYFSFHLTLIIFYSIMDSAFNTHFLFALYALPNLMCLISGYVLAIVTHWHGYKTHQLDQDGATNSWIANIYTLGEGWHNNHHADPKRLRQGEEWWEWDLPAFVIERFLDDNRVKKQPH